MNDDSDTDTAWRVEPASDVEPRRVNRWGEVVDYGGYVTYSCPWCGAVPEHFIPNDADTDESLVLTCPSCGREAALQENSDGHQFVTALMSSHDLAYLQWLTAKAGRPISWSEVTPW